MNKININNVIKEINHHLDDDEWDPNAQLDGYGADFDQEEINESEISERSKFKPNKASLMLDTLSEANSWPIFLQKKYLEKYTVSSQNIMSKLEVNGFQA